MNLLNYIQMLIKTLFQLFIMLIKAVYYYIKHWLYKISILLYDSLAYLVLIYLFVYLLAPFLENFGIELKHLDWLFKTVILIQLVRAPRILLLVLEQRKEIKRGTLKIRDTVIVDDSTKSILKSLQENLTE